jgi:hypothetical protein
MVYAYLFKQNESSCHFTPFVKLIKPLGIRELENIIMLPFSIFLSTSLAPARY